MLNEEQRELICGINRTHPKNVIQNTQPYLARVYTVFAYTSFIYIALSTIIYFYFRRKYIRLQKRLIGTQFMVVIGAVAQIASSVYHLQNEQPSYFVVLTRVIALPSLALPVPIWLLDFYSRYVFSKAFLENRKANNDGIIFKTISMSDSTSKDGLMNVDRHRNINTKMKSLSRAVSHLLTSNNPTKDDIPLSSMVTHLNGISTPQSISSSTVPSTLDHEAIKFLKLLNSGWVHIIMYIVVSSPLAITFIYEVTSDPCLSLVAKCYDCKTTISAYVIYGVGSIMALASVFFANLVKTYPDPFGVLKQVKCYVFFGAFPFLLFFFLKGAYPEGFNPYFGFSMLMHFAIISMVFITNDLSVYYAIRDNSEIGYKHQADGDDHANVSPDKMVKAKSRKMVQGALERFKALLLIPEELTLFEKHLVSEFAVETILMYLDCEKFRDEFYDLNEKTRRARAKRIVLHYVDDSATVQVNLPYSVKNKLLNAVNDSAPIEADVFKESQRELFGMLIGSYLRYIKSKLYRDTHLQ